MVRDEWSRCRVQTQTVLRPCERCALLRVLQSCYTAYMCQMETWKGRHVCCCTDRRQAQPSQRKQGPHLARYSWGQMLGRILVFCVKNHDIKKNHVLIFLNDVEGAGLGNTNCMAEILWFYPKMFSMERAYKFLFSLVKAVSMMTLIMHRTQCDNFPQWCRGGWTGKHKLHGWDSLILSRNVFNAEGIWIPV